jgi:hypothetical protein
MNLEEKKIIYYGEIPCQATYGYGKACRNKAYFKISQPEEFYVCGQHVKKYNNATELFKNPNKKKDTLRQLSYRQSLVEKAAEQNRAQNSIKSKAMGFIGQVICTKMFMMRDPQHIDGFLKVFPNFKHQNRKDGYGCKALSPKAMGPILHNQPRLPPAKNLENFWQFSKVFPDEVDEKGEPTPAFFEAQIRAFNDPIPHRHKPNAKKSSTSTNINVPLYSVFRRKDGTLVKYKYVESRQIYCNYYERIALKTKEFQHLKDLLKQGYNLQICGYDAYDVTKTPEDHYLDGSKPFGHELVLYTMLVVDDPSCYPWRMYTTEEF